jgi:phosphoribosyl 1,2-cyclic phosphate phosphodiesterase
MMPETHEHVRRIFSYAFIQPTIRESSVPLITIHEVLDDPFMIGGIEFIPIHLRHGSMRVNGYRIGDFAYCTDCNRVMPEGMERLRGVKVLVLDALRHSEHKTHFSLVQAIEVARQIGAEKTYFTHIAHEIAHEEVERGLPEGMHLAYDGLELVIG